MVNADSISREAENTKRTLSLLPGWHELRELSRGDSEVRVAILDGPVDLGHACFRGARLTPIETLASGAEKPGIALEHGTHITSVIFGRGDNLLNLAPECKA